MDLLLVDRLICPSCGPDYGLIFLSREVRDRRLIHGTFGCANCRESYPVVDGFADLRVLPRAPLDELAGARQGDSVAGFPGSYKEEALRLAALIGVTEGPGMVLIKGPAASFAEGVAELVDGILIVGMEPQALSQSASDAVSRMVADSGIPFGSGYFRGVVLSGETEAMDVPEAVRVAAPLSRIVVLNASHSIRIQLEDEGLEILLDEEGVLVGRKERANQEFAEQVPLVPLRGI